MQGAGIASELGDGDAMQRIARPAPRNPRRTLRGGGGRRAALKFVQDFAQRADHFVTGNLAAIELDAKMI